MARRKAAPAPAMSAMRSLDVESSLAPVRLRRGLPFSFGALDWKERSPLLPFTMMTMSI